MRSPIKSKTWREHRKLIKQKKGQKTLKTIESLKEESNKPGETVIEAVNNVMSRSVPYLKSAPTLSLALPGSILDNAQSKPLATYLAGQIARAACIYNISEVILILFY